METPIYAGASGGYVEIFARATRLFIPALLDAAKIETGQKVLDVATGTGAAAPAALELVGPTGSVAAGDISPTMLDAARRNLEGLPISLRISDGQSLDFSGGQFDAVICQPESMFCTDQTRGLSEFHRVLKPGGRMAASVTTEADPVRRTTRAGL